MRRQNLVRLGAVALLAGSLAACGGGDSDDGDGGGGSGGGGAPWILGTTDSVTALDPAGSYDLGSSTLEYNLYQNLLTVPANSSEIVGDAAESCDYDDPQTLTCTLKSGLKFSNGDDLTSSDVKYSFERSIQIQDPNGAAIYLLGSITSTDKDGLVTLDEGAIETPDDTTVVFHLNKPDTTFQYVLTYPGAAAIVDEDVFPADEKLADEEIIGSGPYKLSQYKAGEQAVLEINDQYTGENVGTSEQVFVKYYSEPSALKLAAENGEVDVAWRSLSPTDIADLQNNDAVTVATGKGSEIRYWTWKVDGPVGKQKAIRQAAAQVIDREAIAQDAYDGTVDPLYSIVPPGYAGQKDAFQEKYGDPDPAKAKQILADAGIKTPVDLTVGWTPTHYGPSTEDEANELKRQLDESGLFNVTLKSTEWEQYQTIYKEGAYDLWILGWFPDYPDTDDYLSPFMVDGGFFQNGYQSDEANKLVDEEQGTDDQATREEAFGKLQDLAAEDVPFIPSWVGQNTGVYGAGMEGVEDTLDPAFIFRFWLVSKSS
ncbi:peptide/nickel transport system substrate-binding protein [Nocardioides sp. BE266]|uniref:ABC transporter substrate-binding protein n=1 Tax=Nocardioides sp. BE266 TaxID=2817725 RepID=UPI00285ABBE5|nr:ABC transporter substrate-binding protein [Nocardioides sp. BE266]MDR7254412.1 peptide/nickel transport system substrate-binding protein [Nocardioides sp. BE266]